jgi:uncharacterized protein YkwD
MTEMRLAGFRAAAGLLVAFLVGLGWSGCASISQSLAANKRSPGVTEGGAFKPGLPPADSFGPNPKLVCQTTTVNGLVQDVLNDRLKGKTVPEQEGRLCAIAETLLGWQADKDDLPNDTVRAFLSSYFGLTNSYRQQIINTFDSDDPRQLAEPLAEPIATFAEDAKVPRYGLVTVREKGKAMTASEVASASSQGKSTGRTKAVLVMQDQNFELTAPLPRKLPPGGSAQLQARAIGPVSKLKTEIVDVSGKLKTIPSKDQTVQADLSCGDRPGKILVQVSGEREGLDVLLANFTVACGVELPTSVKLPGKQAASTPAQDEQRIVELTNAERAAAGLKPLSNNPKLAEISRRISEDRAKNKGTTSAQLLQYLREADIVSPVIIEIATQALNGEDAFQRFASAPADRAALLNAEANQIGVGVSAGPVVGKIPTVIVTVLLTKDVPPADPVAIKAKLYEAVAQRRKDARAGPLARDPVLESVAQNYADAAAAGSGVVAPEKLTEILAPLYKQSMTVSQMGGFVADQQAALDIAQQPQVMGNAKLVGIGVALGRSPQFGKNSPFVVAFFGTRHPPATKAAPPRKK